MLMDEEESIDSLVTPEKSELNDSNISKNSAENPDAPSNGSINIAEESIDDAHHLKTSIDDAYSAGDSSSMNSAKKSNSTKKSQKVLPRYLRASTGSCHDFCKYGRKHLSEEEKRPWRKRIAKSLPSEQCNVEIFVSGEQKKEKVVNHRQTKDIKNHSSNNLRLSLDSKSFSSKPKSSLDKDKFVRHKLSADTRKYSLDLKPSPDTKSNSAMPKTLLDEEKVVKNKPSKDTKNRSSNLKPNPHTKSHSPKPRTSFDEEKLVKRKPSTGTKNHSPNLPSPDIKPYLRKSKTFSVAKTHYPSQNASSSKNLPSPEPPEIVKSVVFFPSSSVEEVTNGSSTEDRISTAQKNATYLSNQRSSPVKLKAVKVNKSSSFSENSDDIRRKGKSKIDPKTGLNETAASKESAKKKFSPTAATLSPRPIKIASIKSRKTGNSKLVSPLKDQNRLQRIKTKTTEPENVPERTLHVIETETKDKNPLDSIPDDNDATSSPSSAKSLPHAKSSMSLSSNEEDNIEEITEYRIDEVDEFIPDNEEFKKVTPVEENHKKTPKKSRAGISQDKNGSAMKLRFRSGKVVDLQSDNNNSPRRLRFRRAKSSVTDEGKGDLRRKTFKKNAANNDGPSAAERSSEKVVLKHQDVQDKKDAQGLYNNVIEETATKLAESRKSKVKALVGAFETVISLQESKPSSQT